MSKEILYISSACSMKRFKSIEKGWKENSNLYGMPLAGNKFHNLIIQGFNQNGHNVTALVGLPISYKTHKKIFWKTKVDKESGISFINIGFINLPIFKQIIIELKCFFRVIKWNRIHKNKERFIIYDASYVSIIPFITFANHFYKCKSIAIFMDVYNYMYDVDTKNTGHSFLAKISRKLMKRCYKKAYGYVFLSEQMNNLINKDNKPYCVIEGMIDSTVKYEIENNKKAKFTIMYAGALRKEYGLEILIKGFQKIKNKNVELQIYGAGNYMDEIASISKIDHRIKYCGSLSNDEILKREKEASLLINPRPSKLEFTKFSFPSKIMEYMSSGVPVLTTKLPTIPKEYYDYLFFIDDESSDGICNSISNVIKLDRDMLLKKGKKAYNFVLKNKSNKKQVEKIIELGS